MRVAAHRALLRLCHPASGSRPTGLRRRRRRRGRSLVLFSSLIGDRCRVHARFDIQGRRTYQFGVPRQIAERCAFVYQLRLAGWVLAVLVVHGFFGVKAAIPAALIAFVLSWDDRENVFGFSPFRVRIQFKRQLLVESGIAMETQLVPPTHVPPTTEYWPLRDGITFSVLRLGLTNTDQNLIYWHHSRWFSTKLETLVQFEQFERAVPAGSALWGTGVDTMTPCLELERGRVGIEVWASCGLTSERKLAAFIPHCMFDAPRLREGKLPPRKRAKVLKQHGWTQDEPTDLEQYGRIPGDFQHSYLSVTVSYI